MCTVWAPKPKELLTAASEPSAGSGRATFAAMSIARSGSGSTRLMVGGTRRSRSAIRDATVSSAPAPPSRWPVIDLVEVTTTWSVSSPRAVRMEPASVRSPWGVDVPCALTWTMSAGVMPESCSALIMAPDWPSPVGSGCTMSWLSAVMPAPAMVP